MFTKNNNNNKDKVHTPLYTTVLKRTVKLTLVLRKGVQVYFEYQTYYNLCSLIVTGCVLTAII